MRRLAVVACFVLASTGAGRGQDWTELGPAPIANGPYTGRVAAIAPSTKDANRYYVGGADGGVWRTTDGGANWSPIGDRLPCTAVGALAVDPVDDRVVYAGMGEANFAHHSRYGLGIAKSTDGGASWAVYGATQLGGRCVSRLRIDPKDPRRLYASSTRAGGFLPPRAAARGHPGVNGPIGVWLSRDAGSTWQQLGNGIPTDLSATDLALDPANSSVVYAAFGDIFGDSRNGIYKSTDGGTSWGKLSGLPTFPGRVSIAVAPSRPQRLYAVFVRPASPDSGGAATMAAYKSDDAGLSWGQLTSAGSFQATYGWYLSVVSVRPTDPDVVLFGGLTLRVSVNAGGSFATRTPPHVDLHALEWDANGRLLCGDDGGVHRSDDLGLRWTSLNANLGLVQIYAGISLHPSQPNTIYAGFQDNGSARRTSGLSWTSFLGGDGGYTGIDPTATRVFAEVQGTGTIFRSVNNSSFASSGSGINGGDRNCFLCPYEIDPQDGMRMLYGTQRVYLSTNGGQSWSALSPDLTGGASAAIHGLAIAPSDGRWIYVKTNDGRVQVSEDGGASWQLRRSGVPGWFRTTRPFAIHPQDPKRVWLAVGWFGVEQLLASDDGGRSWRSIDGNLPDVPVHCTGVDTRYGEPPLVYAGTDRGVWRTVDGGKTWEQYGRGLPNVPVIDLRLDPARTRVVVATQGRGVWQSKLLPREEIHSVQTWDR